MKEQNEHTLNQESEGDTGQVEFHNPFQVYASHSLRFSHKALLIKSSNISNSSTLETKILTHGPLRDPKDPNCNTWLTWLTIQPHFLSFPT